MYVRYPYPTNLPTKLEVRSASDLFSYRYNSDDDQTEKVEIFTVIKWGATSLLSGLFEITLKPRDRDFVLKTKLLKNSHISFLIQYWKNCEKSNIM